MGFYSQKQTYNVHIQKGRGGDRVTLMKINAPSYISTSKMINVWTDPRTAVADAMVLLIRT